MGLRGPLPKSRAERLADGNPAKRPLPSPERPLPPGLPEPPAELSRLACEEWARVLPLLAELDRVCGLDRAALALYCEAWADCLRFRKQLDEVPGWIVETPQGQQFPHPAVKMLSTAQRQCASLFGQLGLSPAARLRMPLTEGAERTKGRAPLRDFAARRDTPDDA